MIMQLQSLCSKSFQNILYTLQIFSIVIKYLPIYINRGRERECDQILLTLLILNKLANDIYRKICVWKKIVCFFSRQAVVG